MANRSTGIPTTSSMFACLNLEEEVWEQKKARRNRKQENDQQQQAKKRDEKKKNNSNNNETHQLQQLAFGKANKKSGKKSGKQSQSNNNNEKGNWDQWMQHDKEVVEDQFKEDLAKALLESRLQQEQSAKEAKEKQQRIDAGIDIPETREERKKKKQKEKAKSMSIDEFNQLPSSSARKTSPSENSDVDPVPSPSQRVPSTEHDSKFFNDVDKEKEHILRQDKMQEDYRKTFAADNAVVAKLKHDLEQKDKTIEELNKKMEKMEEKMKQVKHRNKQLCFILAQGEMKDKAQVLLQVEELTSVKTELTEQVTTLTAELEKEKSKNSALKTESDKLKAQKHSK